MGRRRKPKGLGDTLETITEVTGIKTLVEKVVGKDCGCAERKEFLNNLFPYVNKKPACMNEEQITFYEDFKTKHIDGKTSSKITNEELKEIISLYNTIFQVNVKGCESCNIMTYIKRIDNVYQKVVDNGKA